MPEKPEEQLEFLRREDIRTMAKDMARLREEESKKERERIIQIQTAPKGKPAPAVPTAPEPPKVPLMPASSARLAEAPAEQAGKPSGFETIKGELPKPLSRTRKIVVRVVVVFLLLFIAANAAALAYSFWKGWTSKQQGGTLPSAQKQETPQPQTSFPIPLQQTVSAASAQDIIQIFSGQHEQGLTRIVLASYPQPPQELLAPLGATIPEQVAAQIDTPSLLFLHALGEKKRLGIVLVTKEDQETTQGAISQWEPTMETDLAPFFKLMGDLGKEGHAPSFKSTERNGTTIRFQTISLNDFGVVYAISHNFLVITSSLESAEKIVDILDNPTL